MTHLLPLIGAGLLAVCGPAWADDCLLNVNGKLLQVPGNVCAPDPAWATAFPPVTDPTVHTVTVNGITITYPAADTATVGADGNVTITEGK